MSRKFQIEYCHGHYESDARPKMSHITVVASDGDKAIRAAEDQLYANWPTSAKVKRLSIGKIVELPTLARKAKP